MTMAKAFKLQNPTHAMIMAGTNDSFSSTTPMKQGTSPEWRSWSKRPVTNSPSTPFFLVSLRLGVVGKLC